MRNGSLWGRALLSAALYAVCHGAQAQGAADAYPVKPITIIVPYGGAGGVDNELRLYIPAASEMLGKPLLIDYKGGAGTTLGSSYVAKSAPDGYTLLAAGTTFTLASTFYEGTATAYDPVKDFAPVTLMTKKPWVIVAGLNTPYNNITEYLAYTRAHPGEVNFSHSGIGSLTHFPGLWLHSDTRTKVTFVPYKDPAGRLTDLMAGRVQVSVVTMLQGMTLVKAGKMKVLGLINDRRSPLYPDVPTLAEQGVPGIDYQLWIGVVAPARVAVSSINKVNAGFQRALKDPAVIRKLSTDGTEVIAGGPDEFRKLIATEAVRYRKLIKDNDIKVEE